ncbi:hypothetical protein [Sphingopyxis chilensis]
MIIGRAIRHYLEPLGFRSFDHSWTEQQALAAAEKRMPDLIVIGDELESGSAFNAASAIGSRESVPVLMVNGDPAWTRHCLEHATIEAGPFELSDIETAVDRAFRRGPRNQAAVAGRSARIAPDNAGTDAA